MLRRFLAMSFFWIAASMILPTVASSVAYSPIPLDTRVTMQAFASSPGQSDSNRLLGLTNELRGRQGLPPLRANAKLSRIALLRAADMVARQYYAHKNPDGKYYYDYLSDSGSSPDYSCENLDMTVSTDPVFILNDWSSSQKGHRECLLNSQVIEAGYASMNLTKIDLDGTPRDIQIYVAIHSTVLPQGN